MPRQNREAPGCYVPSGGLSHCEIVPLSDTYCCPKSCRVSAGRIRFGGTTAHVPQLYQIMWSTCARWLKHEDYRGVSTHLHFHVLHAYRTPEQSGRG